MKKELCECKRLHWEEIVGILLFIVLVGLAINGFYYIAFPTECKQCERCAASNACGYVISREVHPDYVGGREIPRSIYYMSKPGTQVTCYESKYLEPTR